MRRTERKLIFLSSLLISNSLADTMLDLDTTRRFN